MPGFECDNRWSIYDVDSLKSFKEKMIPEITFKKNVNKDVVNSFSVVEKLLIHSYYEYEFYDVAATKALTTFEMALKLRYEELNDKKWPKRKSLKELIAWFSMNNYFESTNNDFLDHLRGVRNHFSHPSQYSFGGAFMRQWIEHPIDLVNDIYCEHIELRKERNLLIDEMNVKLKGMFPDGAIFSNGKDRVLIYEIGIIFIDNHSQTNVIHGYLKRIFEITDTDPAPGDCLVFFSMEGVKKGDELSCLDGNYPFSLTHPLKENKKRIASWFKDFKMSENHIVFNSSLIMDITKQWQTIRRKIQFNN